MSSVRVNWGEVVSDDGEIVAVDGKFLYSLSSGVDQSKPAGLAGGELETAKATISRTARRCVPCSHGGAVESISAIDEVGCLRV